MDYFDFRNAVVYDFGVSLCGATSCFLLDNNGNALTNMEWDDFMLENGKIKAFTYNDDYFEINEGEMIKEFKLFDLK